MWFHYLVLKLKIVLASCNHRLSWLKILLKELGFVPKKPMVLVSDNMAAIGIANNRVQHDRTKHVELDKNNIKDNLDFGSIEVPYTKSSN